MTVPSFQDLMLPVLMAASNGEVRISDVVERLGAKLSLSQEDRAQLVPSGTQTIFSNRVRWARTYIGKAGLVRSTRRGYFTITPRGAEVLKSPPARITQAFLRQFAEYRDFVSAPSVIPSEQGGGDETSVEATQTPDEVMRAAHRQINAALAQELLDRIREAPPDFFERLIITLLLKMGYGGSVEGAGRALGRSGDDGVDGVIDQDALGLDRVYVQAKRYREAKNVGSSDIRDFFGSLDRHKAAKGLFVTTSAFSSAAVETAEHLSKRIVLIDGGQLTSLMISHNVGCRIEETLQLRRLDEDFFD